MTAARPPADRRAGADGLRVVELTDERAAVAEEALQLIIDAIPARDRHPTSMLRAQLRDTRLGVAGREGYHYVALLDATDAVQAVASGRYMPGANTGFVMYLAVREEQRGRGLGTRAREALVERFRADARAHGHGDTGLAAVVGEITYDKPWLLALVRAGTVVPLDLEYYHPGMAPGAAEERYVLYRQGITDARTEFTPEEVRALLEAVWVQGYSFRDPRVHPGYRAMLAQLEGRATVGVHPDVARLARERAAPRA